MQRASREVFWPYLAQHHIGIRDRRVPPVPAIAGRARLGAGALGPNLDAPEAVHRRDGTAAGPDFHHFDDGNAHGQPRSFLESIGAAHLELPGQLGLGPVDQADLGRGAAHIEGQHLVQPAPGRDVRRQYRPAGRTRLDQPDRKAGRGGKIGQAAAGRHQQDRAMHPTRDQLAFEALQIRRHQRLHIGIGTGCRQPLELADLRAHLAGEGYRYARQPLSNHLGHRLLMVRLAIAVQQSDGHALHALLRQPVDSGGNRRPIEGYEHLAIRGQAFPDRQPQVPGHKRRGPVDVDVVLLEAVLERHLQGIPVSLGGQERRSGAPSLDQGIGGQRGAMQKENHLGGLAPRFPQYPAEAVQHRIRRILVGGEHLAGIPGFAVVQDDVGKGSADIRGDPHTAHALAHLLDIRHREDRNPITSTTHAIPTPAMVSAVCGPN